MKLEWSPWALQNSDAIFDFIEQHNPRETIEIDTRIAEQSRPLILILTHELKRLLESIQVQVLDHFIVGEGQPYSFAESGRL